MFKILKACFSRGQYKPINVVHNESTYDDDAVQFCRLISEISQLGLSKKQIKKLAVKMGLAEVRLRQIISRAEVAWQDVQDGTDPDGYQGRTARIQGILAEEELYQPVTSDEEYNAQLGMDPNPHEAYAEINIEQGFVFSSLTAPPPPGSATPKGMCARLIVSEGSPVAIVQPPEMAFLEAYEDDGLGTVVIHGMKLSESIVDGSMIIRVMLGESNGMQSNSEAEEIDFSNHNEGFL